MKISQIVFLGVAVAAGAAAFMMSGGSERRPPVRVVSAPAPQEPIDHVLVASRDIPLGAQVNDADMSWQAWPKKAIGGGMIAESAQPKAMADIQGSIARASFLQGEPIRKQKLVKGANSGFLAAVLPSGERAVAINIDSQGATTAGGFVLPNDRVDVLRTTRDEAAAKMGNPNAYRTETILTNIRVLAIGQNVQEKNNERVVVGSNATLEVTPEQAEILVEAQRVGQLSLALRSLRDSHETASSEDPESDNITVVRYGVALTSSTN